VITFDKLERNGGGDGGLF